MCSVDEDALGVGIPWIIAAERACGKEVRLWTLRSA